jgi:hypothetical protein
LLFFATVAVFSVGRIGEDADYPAATDQAFAECSGSRGGGSGITFLLCGMAGLQEQ